MDQEASPPAAPPSRPGLLVLVLVAALAAVAVFFLLRRSPEPKAAQAPEIKSAAKVLVPGSPVILTGKAAIVADRYNCLCGECSDTLGKCTCARDKGSNEMKDTLNRLAEEKKNVSEIDAAMAGKYGSKVLVSGVPAPPAAPAGN